MIHLRRALLFPFIALIVASIDGKSQRSLMHSSNGMRCCNTEGCRPFLEIIDSEYERYMKMMLRGIGSIFIQDQVKYRVKTLSGWIFDKCDCGKLHVREACLTNEDLDDYFDTIAPILTPEQTILNMSTLNKDIFYIKPSNNADMKTYPDSRVSFRTHSREAANTNLHATEQIGDEKANVLSHSKTLEESVHIPSGVDIFYEPAEDTKCTIFNRYTNFETNLVNAKQFAYEVMKMVVEMHLCNAKYDDYTQIVHHLTGYLFTGIRCKRKERSDLMVSRVFMPWYKQIYNDSIPQHCDFKNVTAKIIQEHLDWFVEHTTSHYCWGMVRCFRFVEGRIVLHDYLQDLFSPKYMDLIRDSLKKNKNEGLMDDTDLKIEAKSMEQVTIQNTRRTTSTCDDGFYLYDGSICCGIMCRSMSLLEIAGILSEADCCAECNSAFCGYGDLFENLSPIELDPYGREALTYYLALRVTI